MGVATLSNSFGFESKGSVWDGWFPVRRASGSACAFPTSSPLLRRGLAYIKVTVTLFEGSLLFVRKTSQVTFFMCLPKFPLQMTLKGFIIHVLS